MEIHAISTPVALLSIPAERAIELYMLAEEILDIVQRVIQNKERVFLACTINSYEISIFTSDALFIESFENQILEDDMNFNQTGIQTKKLDCMRNWRVFKVEESGTNTPERSGVRVALCAEELASQQIPILYTSSKDTDFLLVHSDYFNRACNLFLNSGWDVLGLDGKAESIAELTPPPNSSDPDEDDDSEEHEAPSTSFPTTPVADNKREAPQDLFHQPTKRVHRGFHPPADNVAFLNKSPSFAGSRSHRPADLPYTTKPSLLSSTRPGSIPSFPPSSFIPFQPGSQTPSSTHSPSPSSESALYFATRLNSSQPSCVQQPVLLLSGPLDSFGISTDDASCFTDIAYSVQRAFNSVTKAFKKISTITSPTSPIFSSRPKAVGPNFDRDVTISSSHQSSASMSSLASVVREETQSFFSLVISDYETSVTLKRSLRKECFGNPNEKHWLQGECQESDDGYEDVADEDDDRKVDSQDTVKDVLQILEKRESPEEAMISASQQSAFATPESSRSASPTSDFNSSLATGEMHVTMDTGDQIMCLQLTLSDNINKHGLIKSCSDRLSQAGINFAYSSTVHTANILVARKDLKTARRQLLGTT